MKKKLLSLLILPLFALTLGACKDAGKESVQPVSPASNVITKSYTVAFEVDGERFRTCRVKEGEKITESIPNPSKEGYRFVGWYNGDTLIDLETFIVTENVTLTAKFELVNQDDVLNVDDVKDASKSYYLVLGWWEVNDPDEPDKVTSGLTRDSVRLFYANLIKYLKATGATDDEIAAISFRNYSSKTVSDMGDMIVADGDVDLMIGVGVNIFSKSAAEPYNTTDDSKFDTPMGEKTRYVAIMKDASDLAKRVYDWLDLTEAGRKSFLAELTDEEIEASLVPVEPEEINLTVVVHGDTDETTVIDDKDDVVTMPTITVPEGSRFKGFALEEGGEVVLKVAINAKLTYADLKELAGDKEQLDLYPVFEEITTDLDVYIQVNGDYLKQAEAELLAARFIDANPNKEIKFNIINGNASAFSTAVGNDGDVLIGGDNPLKNYEAHEDGALVVAGAKHFANTSREVMIRKSVAESHVDLAKSLYNFVKNEAEKFVVHTTFWTNNNEWITKDEIAAVKTGVEGELNKYLAVDTETETPETLLGKYNVELEYYEAEGTKVGDLCTETKALREGKGTDLIVACGKNVDSSGNMEIVEKKTIGSPFVAADKRYVALVRENGLTRDVFDNYFATPASEGE